MRPLWWMVTAACASCAVVTASWRSAVYPEALFGMIGPLLVAGATWVVTERTYQYRPERLTAMMVKGLVLKAVFFGAYVALMLRLLDLRPVPFVASFTGYFVGLHVMEALFMRRLFAEGIRAVPR